MLHALILGLYFAFVVYLFYYYLKDINYSIKKKKKKKKKKNRKKSQLRGFSLRRYVVTRYAVTRFTNNPSGDIVDRSRFASRMRRFSRQAECVFDGPLHEKEESVKVSYLKLWVGDKGLDVFEDSRSQNPKMWRTCRSC